MKCPVCTSLTMGLSEASNDAHHYNPEQCKRVGFYPDRFRFYPEQCKRSINLLKSYRFIYFTNKLYCDEKDTWEFYIDFLSAGRTEKVIQKFTFLLVLWRLLNFNGGFTPLWSEIHCYIVIIYEKTFCFQLYFLILITLYIK